MFLSHQDSYDMNYQSYETSSLENNNIQVCLGEFSGSNSNYSMLKSNCFQLMKEKCSNQWDETCDKYVKSTNPKEAELFRSSIQNMNVPILKNNNCYETKNPYIPSQSLI